MIIYFAGEPPGKCMRAILSDAAPQLNVLESFYNKVSYFKELIPRFNSFMLDSGAFSLIRSDKHPNLEKYAARYIEYINDNDVKLFFELDIYKLIGIERVKEIRRRLERETGRRPIPVFHRHLGKEEFIRMCDEYDYVAIGGFAIRDIAPSEFRYIYWFINEAHKRGTKIHGLGFTRINWLSELHFDSVDSTTWTTGNQYGYLCKFDGRTMRKIFRPPDTRAKPVETAINNFAEWLKFAEYADKNL